MKIALIMASPRKRDSLALANQFIEALALYEPVEPDWIWLKDEAIGDCRGCGACLRFGEERCPLKDALPAVVERIKAAETVVFVSPVYACQVTAQFKRFVDRLAWLFHRPALDGKPAALLVTTGGGGVGPTMRYLELAAAGWGCRVAARFSLIATFYFDRPAPEGWYDPDYRKSADQAIARQARRLWQTVVRMRAGREPRPGFYELFLFQGLRSKAAFSEADTAYWRQRGWMEADWYRPVRLGLIKLAYSRLLAGLFRGFGRMVEAGVRRREGRLPA